MRTRRTGTGNLQSKPAVTWHVARRRRSASSSSMRLLSGSLALQALAGPAADVDAWWPLESPSSLRTWLVGESLRWAADDPCFAAQRAIGCAELAAGDSYQACMRKRDDAAAAYQLAPARVDIENKERALSGGDKAMAGLQAFVDAGSDGDDEQLRAKRSRAGSPSRCEGRLAAASLA